MNRTLLLISLLIGLASCRSTKITEPVYTKAPKTQELIDSVQDAHFNFEWMSAKISGKYKGADQSFSFKGSCKIRKDSLIWMSISPGLGLELGRVLMDVDTVHFMNRFDKTYYKSSYTDLSDRINSPLSYGRLQAILTGNAISDFESKKYYTYVLNQLFVLSSASEKQLRKWEKSRRKPEEDVYSYSVLPTTAKIRSQQIQNYKQNRKMLIEYDDFESHNRQVLAESIDLSIYTNQEISLSLSYSKINLSKKLKFPFKVPKSYEIIR